MNSKNPWAPMQQVHRKEGAAALREAAERIENGEVYAFLYGEIDTTGRPRSACGAHYNSDIALMTRSVFLGHFTCECGEVGCPTNLAQLSLIQLLQAYLAGDDKPKKGN